MESIEVLEAGKLLSFRFDEMLNYHGPGFPGGVAHGFKVMQRAFPLLDDGNLLERRGYFVRDGFSRAGGAGCL